MEKIPTLPHVYSWIDRLYTCWPIQTLLSLPLHHPYLPRRQDRAELGRGHRGVDQVALHLVATTAFEEGGLVGELDAFGDYRTLFRSMYVFGKLLYNRLSIEVLVT